MRHSLASSTLLELFTMTQKVSFMNRGPLVGGWGALLHCPHCVCALFIPGFLEKNRDFLSSDLIQLVQKSTSKLLKEAFHDALSSFTPKTIINPRIITKAASVRVSGLFVPTKAIYDYSCTIQLAHNIEIFCTSDSKMWMQRSAYQLWLASFASLWIHWWRRWPRASPSSYAASNPMTSRSPWWWRKLHLLRHKECIYASVRKLNEEVLVEHR